MKATMDWSRRPAAVKTHQDDGSNETGARKRARSVTTTTTTTTTTHSLALPHSSSSYHMAVVGPAHLTQPLATALLQVSSSCSTLSSSSSTTSDADLLAVQALQRSLQYEGSEYAQSQAQQQQKQRQVHVFENIDPAMASSMNHIVLVTQCSPEALQSLSRRQSLSQLPAVQVALQQLPKQRQGSVLMQQCRTSVLLCIVPDSVDGVAVAAAAAAVDSNSNSSAAAGGGNPKGVGMAAPPPVAAVFTCWHPEWEESRRTVARLLWKRCWIGMRQGPAAASPLILASVAAK